MADPALYGLVGVLAGGAISGFTSYFTTRASNAHARRLASDDRDAAATAARDSYQTETLHELQMGLQRVGRATFAASVQEHVNGGKHDDALSVAMMESLAAVTLLNSRVTDDEVRTAVAAAIAAGGAFQLSPNLATADQERLHFAVETRNALEVLGDAIRLMPPPSVYRPIYTTPFLDTDRERASSSDGLSSPAPVTGSPTG